jgi:hypothetical protein
VRVFRVIVQSFVLPMLHARQDLAFRRSITSEFICDDHWRHIAQSLEELAKKSLGSVFVAPTLRPAYQARCRPDPLLSKDSAFFR